MNVIGVAQNVNRSRPLVINYSLLISGQCFKGNALTFLLSNVLPCVKLLLFSLPNYVINKTSYRKSGC